MASNNVTSAVILSPITSTLDFIQSTFIRQIPLVFCIVGFFGFLGNTFTFLQPNLRWNAFCIYCLAASTVDVTNLGINLLPNYFNGTDKLPLLVGTRQSCKWKLFGLVFLPQLSMNLLILSLIDRYACACSLTSRLRQLHQLKLVPLLIVITMVISGLQSTYSYVIYELVPVDGCVPVDPLLNGILYIILHGLITPLVMFLFVLLTYQRMKQSRRRVVGI